ncbi:ATP-dependent DNA ligase [Paenibacillus abyssi]|nr:DNA ligase [Paenibacillus abyssi]
MAPISDPLLPKGPEWGFQIKWDGVRILARIRRTGEVELYSRKLLLKNSVYPEITRLLSAKAAELGDCLLDGEIVYWDGERPNFQKVLQRERMRGTASAAGADQEGRIVYVLFDLLSEHGIDLRRLPYQERHERLAGKFASKEPELFVTDLFHDGDTLWQWVAERQWEGVVSKRLSSPYREGKKHRDWLKKKTALIIEVEIVGLKLREGKVASLVMALEGAYFGSVSLGLDEAMKRLLHQQVISSAHSGSEAAGVSPFPALPKDLRGETIVWLKVPLPCRVTGLEMTSAGLLRHPKLVSFGHSGHTQ